MTLPVFVVSADDLRSDVIELAGSEGHHAAAVVRVRAGERIVLTDTRGEGAECEVVSVSRHGLVARVRVRRREPPATPRLVVVQAIPKGDHAERAVDLLTEVGADRILAWSAARNVVSWKGEREAKSLARWRGAAHAAAKQSRRLRFPEVDGPVTTADVAALVASSDLALVLHEHGTTTVDALTVPSSGEVVLVVGPEGGIRDDELDELTRHGGIAIALGGTVLRSSTAGVVGAAAVLSRTPRWARLS